MEKLGADLALVIKEIHAVLLFILCHFSLPRPLGIRFPAVHEDVEVC